MFLAVTQASFALPGLLFSLGYQMTAYSGLCAENVIYDYGFF
jgi:hypothetical protein